MVVVLKFAPPKKVGDDCMVSFELSRNFRQLRTEFYLSLKLVLFWRVIFYQPNLIEIPKSDHDYHEIQVQFNERNSCN